MDQISIITCI